MRIDTQKQTLTARDESIKKLLEMLQSKGEGRGATFKHFYKYNILLKIHLLLIRDVDNGT